MTTHEVRYIHEIVEARALRDDEAVFGFVGEQSVVGLFEDLFSVHKSVE